MEEKLIIPGAGFPIIYDMTLFAYRDQAWDKIAGIVAVSDELVKYMMFLLFKYVC